MAGGFALPPEVPAAPVAGDGAPSADEAAAIAVKLGEYVQTFQALNPSVPDWPGQISAWCEQAIGKAPTGMTAAEAALFFEKLETTALSMKAGS